MKFCRSVYLWFTIKPMEYLLAEANTDKVRTHRINPELINRGVQMYRQPMFKTPLESTQSLLVGGCK